MRSVCFVERIELEFVGNVLEKALCLGDVDNDGENELVVGGVSGDLFVYKGDKLWQSMTGLGPVTGVAVGDLMNCGSNALVVVSGDGWCHIYLCLDSAQHANGAKLELVHNQRIPANTKVVVLGDVQGDGQVDMVLGLTDRVVRIYKWLQSPSAANLVCLNKCESANQVGSVCLGKSAGSIPCILVSQPGATYMTITHREEGNMQVDYHAVSGNKVSSTNISAKMVSNIGKKEAHALVTIDGCIMLIHNQQLLWTLNVENDQLFAADKANVTESEGEELVICSWSGNTYIIDEDSNAVCFQLGEPVQAFTSGLYTSDSTTSFVYVTFNNKVIMSDFTPNISDILSVSSIKMYFCFMLFISSPF
ncbi:hypothetical protein AAG570_001234 [Ranatra chinensis]|uniref:Integrin alpha FG-GAP repeat containing 2 n=1 Tax=Ranatra chinensis TaxID=642074 RepID=A0ABD0YBA9_9HEMI